MVLECPEKFDSLKLSSNPNISFGELTSLFRNHKDSLPNLDLSRHPELTMDFVLNNLYDYKWDFKEISKNPNITMEDIEKHKYFVWDPVAIMDNPNLTYETYTTKIYSEILNKYHPKCDHIVENCDGSSCDCCQCWVVVSGRVYNHPNMNIITLLNSIVDNSEYCCVEEAWKQVGSNPNLTLDIINNPKYKQDLLEDVSNLSNNPNLTVEFLQEHPDLNWDWDALTKNRAFKINDLENKNLPWTDNLTNNPNITPDYLIKNKLMDPIHWNVVSRYMSIKYIMDNKHLPWNYYNLSLNENLTLDDIKNNPDIHWNYSNLSRNRMGYQKSK